MPRFDRTPQGRVPYTEAQETEADAREAAEATRRTAEAALAYRLLRAKDYRDELGKEPGDFIKTLGDVLDVLIEQVEANRVSAGAERTAAFATMLGKIATIKARHPKPE